MFGRAGNVRSVVTRVCGPRWRRRAGWFGCHMLYPFRDVYNVLSGMGSVPFRLRKWGAARRVSFML